MIRIFRSYFQQPDWKDIARRELADARRELLSAQSAREYAEAMVDYNAKRVERLQSLLNANIL